jgi:hypothetical protein
VARQVNPLKGVSVESESEIIDEMGGEDIEGDRVEVDGEKVKEAGAMNAEAVQSNRRRKNIQDKKRGGVSGVAWNEQRAPLLYDDILGLYPANTLMIFVERLTGTPASWYLYGQPKGGGDLYQAIRQQCHGRREETEYRVVFRDAHKKFDRGIGRLVIPSTLDDFTLSANPQNAPIPGGTPPGSTVYGTPSQGAPSGQNYAQPQYGQQEQQQQQQPRYAPPPQYGPQPQPQPQSQDFSSLMEIQRQVAELNGRLTAVLSQPAPQPQAAPAPPPQFVQIPHSAPAPAPAPAQAPQQQVQPPAGMFHIPGFGFVPTARLFEALSGAPGVAPALQVAPAPRPSPPQPEPTAADQFRNAIGLIKTAVDAASTMQSILPQQPLPPPPTVQEKEEDESLTKIMQLGDIKAVVNKADGNVRLVDTALANSDKIMSWIDKTRQQMQQSVTQPQSMQQMPQVPQQQPQQQQPQQPQQIQAPPQPLPQMPLPTFPR